MTHDQEHVLELLDLEPITSDEIAAELRITDDRVLVALRTLENLGLCRSLKTIPRTWVTV